MVERILTFSAFFDFQTTLRRSSELISPKNESKDYYERNPSYFYCKRPKCSLQDNSKNPCLLDAFSKKQESVPKTHKNFFLVSKMKSSHTNVAKCNTENKKKKHKTDNL